MLLPTVTLSQNAEKVKADRIAAYEKRRMHDSTIMAEQRKRFADDDSIAKVRKKNERLIHTESDYISKCITAPSYTYSTETSDVKINAVAVVCFNNSIASFYTKKTGSISFRISQPVGSAIENNDGTWTYIYISEESGTTPFAWYTLQVIHNKTDNKKIVAFSFSSTGNSYLFTGNGYASSTDISEFMH